MPHDLRLALDTQPLRMLKNLLRGHLHSCGLPDACSPCSSWPSDLPSASAAAAAAAAGAGAGAGASRHVEMREIPNFFVPDFCLGMGFATAVRHYLLRPLE